MPARRFLAPQARSGNGHGYLTQPQRPYPEHSDPTELARERERVAEHTRMCDEPEAPGPDIIDAQRDLARTYDRLRHHADVQQREEIRQHLTVEHRMAEAHRRAKQQRIDLSSELHACKQMLDRARKGGRTEPPALLRKLTEAEARLDHRPDLADAA